MKIFLNFILLALLVGVPCAWAEIEIYSAGRHFNSFEDYQRVTQGIQPAPQVPSGAVSQNKVPVLEPGQQKLIKMSYNNGVRHVVVNFDQNWQNPKPRFIVGEDELQYTIQEALENHHGPAILISDPKKLRILSFKSQISSRGTTENLDKTPNK